MVVDLLASAGNPVPKWAQELPRAPPPPRPVRVGMAVIVDGLVKAPQYNGKRGIVTSHDAAADRFCVALDGGAGTISARRAALRAAPRAAGNDSDGDSDDDGGRSPATKAMVLRNLRVCLSCGKREEIRRQFKACPKCRAVYYCGRACQSAHWQHGGHRQVCGRAAADRPTVARAVAGARAHDCKLFI